VKYTATRETAATGDSQKTAKPSPASSSAAGTMLVGGHRRAIRPPVALPTSIPRRNSVSAPAARAGSRPKTVRKKAVVQ
jgi:hypothetical protein